MKCPDCGSLRLEVLEPGERRYTVNELGTLIVDKFVPYEDGSAVISCSFCDLIVTDDDYKPLFKVDWMNSKLVRVRHSGG